MQALNNLLTKAFLEISNEIRNIGYNVEYTNNSQEEYDSYCITRENEIYYIINMGITSLGTIKVQLEGNELILQKKTIKIVKNDTPQNIIEIIRKGFEPIISKIESMHTEAENIQ